MCSEKKAAGIGASPVICAPYDTELFGHWWFEGIDWVKNVLRLAAADPEINLATGSQALDAHASPTPIDLPEGSWGEGGFHWVWLNKDTEWTWKLIYQAEETMNRLAQIRTDDDLLCRLIKQAARELFLLQSSDWQFNITSGTSVDYADLRVNWHYDSFRKLAELADQVLAGDKLTADEVDILAYCEERDSLFEDVDPAWYASVEHPPVP